MMDELIVPDAASGFHVETNDTVGKKVVAGPMTAVVVAGWCFDRKINVAQFEICTDRRPDCGIAGVLPGIVAPGVVAEFAGLRNGVKRPQQTPAADIVSTHVTRHVGFGSRRGATLQRCTDDGDITDDHRRRR